MTDAIELVVVEDDPRTLKSLLQLLSTYQDLQVVGSAMNGASAIETIRALEPQLVLLDLELPDLDGIEITRRVKAKQAQVEILILTSFEDEKKVYRAIQAGASGYLIKRVAPERIRDAIIEVLAGGVVIEPRMARRFWNYFQSEQGGGTQQAQDLLDDAEREVLQIIARGLTNQETGEVLSMSRRAVRTHLSHIYQKLGTSSRSEAVVMALRKGMIHL